MVTEVLFEEKGVIPVEPVQMYCKHTLSRSKSNVIDAKKAVTDPNPYICKYLSAYVSCYRNVFLQQKGGGSYDA